jgi:hypothetical protein
MTHGSARLRSFQARSIKGSTGLGAATNAVLAKPFFFPNPCAKHTRRRKRARTLVKRNAHARSAQPNKCECARMNKKNAQYARMSLRFQSHLQSE